MVKLSKPGHHPEYVSYIEQIDDENVLKALEALRSKAVAGSSQGKLRKKVEVPPTSPTIEVSLSDASRFHSKPSIHETPLTPGTVTSSSSNSTSARNTRRKKSGATKKGLDLRARMARNAPSTMESKGTAEFVPKWKLQPLIKRRSIPTWELVTAAQEKFAEEQETAKRSEEQLAITPSLQPKAEQEEVRGNGNEPVSSCAIKTTASQEGSDAPEPVKEVTFPADPLVVRNDTIAPPETITGYMNTTDKDQGLESRTKDKTLEEQTSTREKDMKLIVDFMQTKVSVKKETPDDTANRSALSSFLNKLDCFWMVDPIIEPTTDFEDNFTYCSATDESDASHRNETDEPQNGPDEKITDGEREAIEFLNEQGLDELPPMIKTLSKCNDILAEGQTDPTQLEYISNLLCHMEYKLQDYAGYRRRNDREQPESETDIQRIFSQIDELKKLIFRIVEDFIEDHMVNPWNTEVSSLRSALSDGDTDSLPTATGTLDEHDATSTLGDDSLAQPDILEGKDVTISIQADPSSPGHNNLASLLGSTLSLTSDMSTKRIENTSVASSKLETGDTEFVSAELFVGNPTLQTVPAHDDGDDCASTPPNQSVANQEIAPKNEVCLAPQVKTTNKSNLMKNLSRLLSRSSKKDRSKHQESEDRNPNATEESSRIVKKEKDVHKTTSLAIEPMSNKLRSQSSPARRFFGSRQVTKNESVMSKNTRITLQEAVDNDGSAITEIESVAHVPQRNTPIFTPSSPDSHSSVMILPELSHGDNELYAIESIVRTAAAVM
jgi:hypothetical protein